MNVLPAPNLLQMFDEDELKVYDKKFQAIGILDKEEQKKILEFFYTLGVITFNL